jgi:hypothetical protein
MTINRDGREITTEQEAMLVLDLIVAEFDSDPMSVQCFDLRTVMRAKALVKAWREAGGHLR